MPKDNWKDFKSLLSERGLALRMVDGKWNLVDRPGGSNGLPRKLRAIKPFLGPKPCGSPGRGEPDGYQLQDKLCMSDADYHLVYRDAKTILEHLAVQKLISVHPEFKVFRKYNYWAPRVFFQLILRIKSCEANKASKEPATEQEGDQPNVKPHKKRGKPRKAKGTVPTGEPAPDNAPTPEAQPALQGQPALEDGPIIVDQPARPDQTAREEELVDAAEPAPEVLQGGGESDDGECFELDVPDDLDMTMESALADLTKMTIDSNGQDDDNDDGGVFNMSEVAGKSLASGSAACAPVPEPTSSAAASAPPPSAPAPLAPPGAPSAPRPPSSKHVAKKAPPPSAAPTADIGIATPSTAAPAPVAAPPITTPPPSAAPGLSIVWRGHTISANAMAKLRSAAACQAAGTKPRVAAIYRELIDKLATDPNYDPASDPLPVPKPPAPTNGRGRGRATHAATSAVVPNPTVASTTLANTHPPAEKPNDGPKPKPKIRPIPASEPGVEPVCGVEPTPAPGNTQVLDNTPVGTQGIDKNEHVDVGMDEESGMTSQQGTMGGAKTADKGKGKATEGASVKASTSAAGKKKAAKIPAVGSRRSNHKK